ncbi:hypothetical protein D3C86_1490570 [compost metagenome]
MRSSAVGEAAASVSSGAFFTGVCMNTTISIAGSVGYGADEAAPDMLCGHDVIAAAYDTAHSPQEGIKETAQLMGMSPNTLTHKVNLHNNTHHLALRESVLMQKRLRDYRILHAMARELEHVCILATPVHSPGDAVDTVMRLQMAYADFVQATGEALTRRQHGVTSNQMRKAEHMAAEAIANIGHALALLRGLMPEAPKA